MAGEVGAVPQVPAAAHHRQVDAGPPPLNPNGEDVCVLRGHAGVVFDSLLVQHARQRAELVPDLASRLEAQCLRMFQHLRLQRLHHLLLLAKQETFRIDHVARIVLRRDMTDTRSRTPLDLVQQAGPGTIVEYRVFAGAKAKDLL